MQHAALIQQETIMIPGQNDAHMIARPAQDSSYVNVWLLPPVLRIHLLGTFMLVSDHTPVTGIDMPRLQSLLAYLVFHHNVPQSRTRLASLLWPDSTEEQAHTNLRNLLAQLLLREDPLQEASYRHLMRLYAESGNRSAAIRTYQNCVAVLKRELAVEPGPETRQVYEQLIHSEQLRPYPIIKRSENGLETLYALRSNQ